MAIITLILELFIIFFMYFSLFKCYVKTFSFIFGHYIPYAVAITYKKDRIRKMEQLLSSIQQQTGKHIFL